MASVNLQLHQLWHQITFFFYQPRISFDFLSANQTSCQDGTKFEDSTKQPDCTDYRDGIKTLNWKQNTATAKHTELVKALTNFFACFFLIFVCLVKEKEVTGLESLSTLRTKE